MELRSKCPVRRVKAADFVLNCRWNMANLCRNPLSPLISRAHKLKLSGAARNLKEVLFKIHPSFICAGEDSTPAMKRNFCVIGWLFLLLGAGLAQTGAPSHHNVVI